MAMSTGRLVLKKTVFLHRRVCWIWVWSTKVDIIWHVYCLWLRTPHPTGDKHTISTFLDQTHNGNVHYTYWYKLKLLYTGMELNYTACTLTCNSEVPRLKNCWASDISRGARRMLHREICKMELQGRTISCVFSEEICWEQVLSRLWARFRFR